MVRQDRADAGPRVLACTPARLGPAPWPPSPVGVSWHEMTGVLGYTATKDDLQKRLARIEGQVRGVSKMVAEDRYCIDVLTQISAIQAALDKVALGLLDDHAHVCVMGAEEGRRARKDAGPRFRPVPGGPSKAAGRANG